MAASDARPIPRRNVAYRVTFPILDADGDLVTGAAGLDSEISKDGGTFADCVNEAVEIAAASGVYYLDLTATEMDADTVAVIVKTTTTGAKTTVLVFYPEESGDVRVNVDSCSTGAVTSAAFASGAINASAIAGGAITSATLAADTITASAIASGAITSAKFAADAITASALAADAAGEIADAVWDEDIVTAHGTADTAGRALRTLDSVSDRAHNSNVNSLLGIPDTSGVTLKSILDIIDDYVDELETRLPATLSEPSGAPAATPTIAEALAWLVLVASRKIIQDGTNTKVHNNAGTQIATASTTDSAGVFTRDKFV